MDNNCVFDHVSGFKADTFYTAFMPDKSFDFNDQKNLKEKIFQLSKMALLGTRVAEVGHEIKNPLSVIQAYVDYLSCCNDELSSEQFYRSLNGIQQGIGQILEIVRGLKTYSHSYNNDECLDIHHIIQQTLALIQKIYLKNRISINLHLMSERYIVWGNTGKVQQVLMNIITNSMDAIEEMPDRGKIEIITRNQEGFIIIEINDNGIGLSDQNKEKIFDPFFSTKTAMKGTGLGLYITKKIIEEMKGYILIDSTLGKGCSVKIKLPLSLEM